MVEYDIMKAALQQECPGEKGLAKNFTKDFYKTFLAERRKSFRQFVETGEWGKYTESENSPFYKENGGAWCVMLEIYNASVPEWRVDLCERETGFYDIIDRTYFRAETKEDVEDWARVAYPDYLPEVIKVHGSAEQPKIKEEQEYDDR